MTQVGIRALKQNAAAVVAQAVAGETVTITDRGRPVAQLTAIPSSRLQQLLRSGRARPPRQGIGDVPAPAVGPDLSGELEAMRLTFRTSPAGNWLSALERGVAVLR